MSFDCSAALYLIQFENKNFGFELCPDSDVSTSGLPDVMFSPRQRAEVGLLDTFCSGSSTGHIPGRLSRSSVFTFKFTSILAASFFCAAGLHLPPKECDVLSQLVKFSPTSSRTTAKPSSVIPMCLLDEVANLGAFVLLLEVIDIALARKKQLLNLIEKVNSNVSEKNSLSPQINNGVRLSHVTEDHFLWIRANIERTDQVLFAALEYLRTLYGETYLSPAIIRNRSLGQKDRLQSLDGYLNRKSMQQTCASDWTDNIVAQADDVGYLVASKVMVKAIRPTVVHDDLRDRFTAASQLACTLAYAMDTTTRNPPNELYPAIAVATAWLTASIFPSEDRSHPFYDEILDARDTAANDLNEAVNLLVAELRLSQEVS